LSSNIHTAPFEPVTLLEKSLFPTTNLTAHHWHTLNVTSAQIDDAYSNIGLTYKNMLDFVFQSYNGIDYALTQAVLQIVLVLSPIVHQGILYGQRYLIDYYTKSNLCILNYL